jgi:hypothetical protein
MFHSAYNKIVNVRDWVPLRVHSATAPESEVAVGYEICFFDDAQQPCAIRKRSGADGGRTVSGTQVFIHGTRYSLTHVMMASAFPDIHPLDTVDHIDNDYHNNRVTNLQWMTLLYINTI